MYNIALIELGFSISRLISIPIYSSWFEMKRLCEAKLIQIAELLTIIVHYGALYCIQ